MSALLGCRQILLSGFPLGGGGGDTLQFRLTEKIRKLVFDGLLLGRIQKPQPRNSTALGVTLLVSPSLIEAENFEYFPYTTQFVLLLCEYS